jgi:hypothetical protein
MSDFYNLFKSRLESAEEMPPPEVWNGIEQRLDENLHIQRLQRRFRFLRIAVCFLALILAKQLRDSTLKQNGPGKFIPASAVGLVQDSINPIGKESNPPVRAAVENGAEENQISYGAAGMEPAGNTVSGTRETGISPSSAGTDDLKETAAGSTGLPGQEPGVSSLPSGQQGTDFKTGQVKNTDLDSLSIEPQKNTGEKGSEALLSPAAATRQKNILKNKTPVILLTALLSKDFYFNNTVKGNDFDNESEGEIRDRETNGFSYTLGLLAEYKFSQKWSVQSGLTYSTVNSNIAPSVVKGRNYQGGVKFVLPTTYGLAIIHDHDDMNPRPGDSLHLYGRTAQQLYYLSIPLLLKYQIVSGKKITLTTTAGFALNLITNAKVNASVVKNINQVRQVSASLNGLKHNFYSTYLGLETAYRINPRIALSLQPALRFSLTSFNNNVPVKNSLNSIAVFGGVRISL